MTRATLFTIFSLNILSLHALSAQEQVLHPKMLPSDNEVVNPQRGLYTWLDYHMAPQPDPALDHYKRIPWATLEPAQSRYDFSQIETELSKLSKGGAFGFRIMALNPSWSVKDGSDVPEYLMAAMPKGFFVPAVPRGSKSPAHLYVPDWNSPIFLDRLDKLLAALGHKYDGNPRISFIDIGVYGTWGEWHTFGLSNFPGGAIPYGDNRLNQHGASAGSFETRKRIIDAHVNAFRKTQLVMMTDDKAALIYALRLPTPVPVGMRRDSFGSNHFADDFVDKTMSQEDQKLVLNRWTTAPLIVESFGPPKVFEVGTQGLAEQVETYHVSAIGNGNFGAWNERSAAEQEAVLAAGRRTGYRFALTEAALPSEIKPGANLLLRTRWVNQGVTPSYEPWTVEFTLWKDGGAHPVARVISALNLQTFLPTKEPFEVRDLVTMPKKISKGTYELRVQITDPACYRSPLRLAIEGATAEGSYSLGAIHVN